MMFNLVIVTSVPSKRARKPVRLGFMTLLKMKSTKETSKMIGDKVRVPFIGGMERS